MKIPEPHENRGLGLEGGLSSGRPLIVGTLHERSGLAVARRLSNDDRKVDLLEARLDCLAGISLPDAWNLPVIATARHPGEGGAGNLSLKARRAMLHEAVSWASALDIELRSARRMEEIVATAHQHGRTVIISHHDFVRTPSAASLRSLALRAMDAGADLFKLAAQVGTPSDLLTLAEFQTGPNPLPVVTMGMGSAGRFSRVVLAGMGAPLCYGWLGKPQVSGQWPALGLRSLLESVLPG
jgi:3-dehydroquinate dehydratase-1